MLGSNRAYTYHFFLPRMLLSPVESSPTSRTSMSILTSYQLYLRERGQRSNGDAFTVSSTKIVCPSHHTCFSAFFDAETAACCATRPSRQWSSCDMCQPRGWPHSRANLTTCAFGWKHAVAAKWASGLSWGGGVWICRAVKNIAAAHGIKC